VGRVHPLKKNHQPNIKTALYVFVCFKEISEFLMLLSGGGSTLLTYRLSMTLSWLFRSSALIDLSKCQNISALVTSYKIRAFEGGHWPPINYFVLLDRLINSPRLEFLTKISCFYCQTSLPAILCQGQHLLICPGAGILMHL
jgi:hypothetical protein